MTQCEIARATGKAQSYIHYILNGDRTPSVKMSVALEKATGVCREGWLWPEKHWNPYIPFSESISLCGYCPSKIHRIRKANELCLEIFSEASDKKKAFSDIFRVRKELNGLNHGQVLIFREIVNDSLVLLGYIAPPHIKRPKRLRGKKYAYVIESAKKGEMISVPHWPHDLPPKHPKVISHLGVTPKSFYRISSGRHLTMTWMSTTHPLIFNEKILQLYQQFVSELDEIWHRSLT